MTDRKPELDSQEMWRVVPEELEDLWRKRKRWLRKTSRWGGGCFFAAGPGEMGTALLPLMLGLLSLRWAPLHFRVSQCPRESDVRDLDFYSHLGKVKSPKAWLFVILWSFYIPWKLSSSCFVSFLMGFVLHTQGDSKFVGEGVFQAGFIIIMSYFLLFSG